MARFASSRYLKRGVSDTGNVANDVEVEQVNDFYCRRSQMVYREYIATGIICRQALVPIGIGLPIVLPELSPLSSTTRPVYTERKSSEVQRELASFLPSFPSLTSACYGLLAF